MALLVYLAPAGPTRVKLTDAMTIGRSPECDLVLDDSTVSRRHASLSRTAAGWTIKDLGASKGCFVNGARADAVTLRAGDEIRLGSVVLRYEEDGTGPVPVPARDAQLAGLERELYQARALLALQETFLRCSSQSMLLQAVGRDLVAALRCQRCAIFSRESAASDARGAWSADFLHGVASPPPPWLQTLERGRQSGAFIEAASLVEQRVMVVASLGGGGSDVVLVAELAVGRQLEPPARELTRALCGQISPAVARLALEQRTRREEALRSNLSRYLSEQVAQAVLEGKLDLKLGGQRREVSVLFVDVRGFTQLSEKLEPEEVLQILNEHFGRTVPLIKAAHGTVDKFIGDALMAVFGAPNELADHPLRAVRAAIAIQAAAAGLARELSASGRVPGFAVGVGVNTGSAVAGNLGTDERKEFAVIGDAVNVASRLCANARPGEVLVGPLTAAAIAGQVRLAEPVPIKVKGREQPVMTFRVLG